MNRLKQPREKLYPLHCVTDLNKRYHTNKLHHMGHMTHMMRNVRYFTFCINLPSVGSKRLKG